MNQYPCLISAEVCIFEMLKPLEILLIEETATTSFEIS